MQGQIDRFGPDGTLSGWFRNPYSSEAAIARIAFNDGTVVRIIGDRFRRDLLERGISHGHFGFFLRIPAVVSAGANRATLLDDTTGIAVATAELSGLRVFQTQLTPLLMHVEDIIANDDEWTCEDLIRHVSNLAVEETFKLCGAEIFLEKIANYCFGEFPSELIMKGFVDALESGTVSPERVFTAMLQTKLASGINDQTISGPYSSNYPFI